MLNSRGEILTAQEDAATVNNSAVRIADRIQILPKETAGHEAYHVWKSRASRADYTALAMDEVQWTGEAFSALYDHINEQYFEGAFDMDDPAQYRVFEEELVAYISGRLHNGEDLTGLLGDPAAVRSAWETLVEENRSNQARESRKGLSVDRELDRANASLQEANALLRERTGDGAIDFIRNSLKEDTTMTDAGKKQEQTSYAERLAMALQSMKGKPLPTDFDELETPLRADILEKLHKRHEKPGEN